MTDADTTDAGTATPAPIRTAIVGCGVIGKQHARVLTDNPSYQVVAVVDPHADRTEEAAQLVVAGGDAEPARYADLASALAAGGFELASICTPSGYHVDNALEAARAGLHVMLEKPLDVSVAQGRELAALVAARTDPGQVVSVISQHRFDPAHVATKEAIVAGRLGTVTSALASMAWYRSQEYYDSGDWRGTWALDGGGAVMNQAVHTVDLLRWYLGTPAEISAHAGLLAHERIEVEDVLTATVRFESGALAAIHATTAAYPGLTTRVQVHGTRGSSIVDRDQLEYFHSAVDAGTVASSGSTTHVGANQENQAAAVVPPEHLRVNPPTDAFANAHNRQFDDIADAIRTGRDPGVTVEEALLSLALVRSLYLSAALGEKIVFADVLAGRYDDVETRF